VTDPTCLLWTVCIYWYWMNCWQAKYLPFAHCFCTTSIMYSCVLNDHILTYILCKWKWDCTENYFKNKYSHEIYVHVVAGLCVCVCVGKRETHTHAHTLCKRQRMCVWGTDRVCVCVCVGERDTEKVTNLVFYAQSTVSYIGAMRETHSLSACLSHTQCVCVCVWERQRMCVWERWRMCVWETECVCSLSNKVQLGNCCTWQWLTAHIIQIKTTSNYPPGFIAFISSFKKEQITNEK